MTFRSRRVVLHIFGGTNPRRAVTARLNAHARRERREISAVDAFRHDELALGLAGWRTHDSVFIRPIRRHVVLVQRACAEVLTIVRAEDKKVEVGAYTHSRIGGVDRDAEIPGRASE